MMSQFGSKNAAWARPPGSAQQLNTGLFQNPLITTQPFAQMGMINAAAFTQQAANMGMNIGMLQSPPQPIRMQSQQQQKNRTFSGVVTKIHDSYGFIDDDVFFQVNVVRGALPRAGDRVMVEASFNATMPFKWNAYRVQLINDKGIPPIGPIHSPTDRGRPSAPGRVMNSEQSWSNKSLEKPMTMSHSSMPRQRDMRTSGFTAPRPLSMSGRHRSPPRPVGPPGPLSDLRRPSPLRRVSPPRIVSRRSPKRSPIRDNHSKSIGGRSSPKHGTPVRKHESAKREHSSSVSGRTHSPSLRKDLNNRESLSPPRRRARIIPRYQCYTPKIPVNGVDMTVMQIRKRYSSMYIPSDFIQAKIEWPSSTPIDNALTFSTSPVVFNILHKDVDCPDHASNDLPILNPDDADYRFSCKVILLSHSGLTTIHQKAYGLLADGSIDENSDPMPLKRCFSFLVGTRGKEMMALGGPWSCSLDGANPESDPQVLVRTAIRTVRALTGIDLSKCSKWYKMAELRYYRAEKDRYDTCVLMLPDTCGLMPSSDEIYQQQVAVLRNQLMDKIRALDEQKLESEPAVNAVPAETSQQTGEGNPEQEQPQTELAIDANKEQAQEVQDDDEEELNPTHWSKLDIKTMKVADLRQELMARDLETKGIKTVLCSRLQEAIDKEKTAEGAEMEVEEKEDKDTVEVEAEQKMEPAKAVDKELTEEEKKALEKFEKEKLEKKATLERHYLVSRECGILVYPCRTAKCGKFDCKVVTLHTLLDYRIEDIKEHSFELAIMAECISEMLDRSQAFATYKAVSYSLDKDSEKKRRDEAKLAETFGADVKANTAVEETEGPSEVSAKATDDKKKEDDKREEERKKVLNEPRKVVVVDRASFQAFSHFDQNLCGYLLEKDLEEIWLSIGINVSRSQLQKLLKKCIARDRINYRYLTDSWVNKDGTVTYQPGVIEDHPSPLTLSKGNMAPKRNGESNVDAEKVLKIDSGDSVMVNGSLINITEVMQQLSQMEASRNCCVQKVDVLEAQLKEGAKNTQSLDKKRKRLEDDVEKYRKRLHEAEKCLKSSVDDTVQMKTTFQEFRKIGERMIIMVDKLMPVPKEKEKSSDKDEKGAKKEKKMEKEDKQLSKKKDENHKDPVDDAEEKKDLQLVDEIGGCEEAAEMDVVVLSEEVAGDDEKECKKESSA